MYVNKEVQDTHKADSQRVSATPHIAVDFQAVHGTTLKNLYLHARSLELESWPETALSPLTCVSLSFGHAFFAHSHRQDMYEDVTKMHTFNKLTTPIYDMVIKYRENAPPELSEGNRHAKGCTLWLHEAFHVSARNRRRSEGGRQRQYQRRRNRESADEI